MLCKSGRHEWESLLDAMRCCNGYILAVLTPPHYDLLERLPLATTVAFQSSGVTVTAPVVWMPEKEEE